MTYSEWLLKRPRLRGGKRKLINAPGGPVSIDDLPDVFAGCSLAELKSGWPPMLWQALHDHLEEIGVDVQKMHGANLARAMTVVADRLAEACR